jgi:O-methyltransferase
MTLPKLTPPEPTAFKSLFFPQFWSVRDPDAFGALMKKAAEHVQPGYHFADNLFTWGRNNSMFDDGPFMAAWQDNLHGDTANTATVWRRYILACAAFHCVQLEGDFVECGCYQGDAIKTVVDYLGGPTFPKGFWGYDLFEHADDDPHHDMPEHSEQLYELVKAKFTEYPQVQIIRGRVPEVLVDSPARIAYLHIDLNQAEAEIGALNALFDRVVSAGIVILDDYEWASYRSQKLAEDPWFEARGYRVFPLPTGQGLIIKR